QNQQHRDLLRDRQREVVGLGDENYCKGAVHHEPSRLKEYPIGNTKLMIFLLTGSFSSCAIVTGYAASLLAVPKPSRKGSRISEISRNILRPRNKSPAPVSTSHNTPRLR